MTESWIVFLAERNSTVENMIYSWIDPVGKSGSGEGRDVNGTLNYVWYQTMFGKGNYVPFILKGKGSQWKVLRCSSFGYSSFDSL